jgi:hypothetical protein
VTTFALIHGAWHGAWCWERLLAPLRERGHGVIAVDLPSDDTGHFPMIAAPGVLADALSSCA